MQQDLKKQVTEGIINYAAVHAVNGKDLSNSAIADLCGVSDANIGYIKKGVYEVKVGDKMSPISDSIFAKIITGLGLAIEFIHETAAFKSIMVALIEARKNPEYRIIDGDSGTGKTFTFKHFKRKFPVGTYGVTCADDMSVKGFMQALAEAVGVSKEGSRHKIRQAIVEKLLGQKNGNTVAVIVIDEAENLKDGAYAAIKALYDDLEDLVSIILIGANKNGKNYYKAIETLADKKKSCFPQLFRRFKMQPVLVETLAGEEFTMICHAHGINSKAEIDALKERCNNIGELERTIKKQKRDAELMKTALKAA